MDAKRRRRRPNRRRRVVLHPSIWSNIFQFCDTRELCTLRGVSPDMNQLFLKLSKRHWIHQWIAVARLNFYTLYRFCSCSSTQQEGEKKCEVCGLGESKTEACTACTWFIQQTRNSLLDKMPIEQVRFNCVNLARKRRRTPEEERYMQRCRDHWTSRVRCAEACECFVLF